MVLRYYTPTYVQDVDELRREAAEAAGRYEQQIEELKTQLSELHHFRNEKVQGWPNCCNHDTTRTAHHC